MIRDEANTGPAEFTVRQPRDERAYCHIASAKKDDVWTQFYRLLDTRGMPDIK